MNATAQSIVDSAEAMIREGGYHSFSFRQIADELEIKSASVHYHFPTKEALGAAVAKRYTERFVDALGDPKSQKDALGNYVKAFQDSLKRDKRSCLCGILAAESGRLPESVRKAIQQFTEQNLRWLQSAVKSTKPDWTTGKCKETAMLVFSALEGAMIFAAMIEEPSHLQKVGKSLRALVA